MLTVFVAALLAAPQAGLDRVPFTISKPSAEAPVASRTADDAFLGVGFAEAGSGAVALVVPGSAAERAGIQVGDVLVAIGDAKVASGDDVRAALAGRSVGERVTVVFTRGTKKISSSVELGRRDGASEAPRRTAPVPAPAPAPIAALPAGPGYLGVSIQGADRGVAVVEVNPDGPAAQAGLRVGDLILRVAGSDANSVEGLIGILDGTKAGQRVPVVIERRKGDDVEELRLAAVLGARPGSAPAAPAAPAAPQAPAAPRAELAPKAPAPAREKLRDLGYLLGDGSGGLHHIQDDEVLELLGEHGIKIRGGLGLGGEQGQGFLLRIGDGGDELEHLWIDGQGGNAFTIDDEAMDVFEFEFDEESEQAPPKRGDVARNARQRAYAQRLADLERRHRADLEALEREFADVADGAERKRLDFSIDGLHVAPPQQGRRPFLLDTELEDLGLDFEPLRQRIRGQILEFLPAELRPGTHDVEVIVIGEDGEDGEHAAPRRLRLRSGAPEATPAPLLRRAIGIPAPAPEHGRGQSFSQEISIDGEGRRTERTLRGELVDGEWQWTEVDGAELHRGEGRRLAAPTAPLARPAVPTAPTAPLARPARPAPVATDVPGGLRWIEVTESESTDQRAEMDRAIEEIRRQLDALEKRHAEIQKKLRDPR